MRSIPFATRRPTFTEITRCFNEFFTVRIVEEEIIELEKKKAPVVASPPKPVQPSALDIKDPDDETDPLSDTEKQLVEFIKAKDAESLAEAITSFLARRLRDKDGTSLLHIAAKEAADTCIPILVAYGADVCMRAKRGGNTRPYDVCKGKSTRQAFIACRSEFTQIDWDAAGVPVPLGEEEARIKAEKAAEKKKRMREKEKERKREKREKEEREAAELDKQLKAEAEAAALRAQKDLKLLRLSVSERNAIGLSPEARMRLDREKRAMAAEARMRTQNDKCAACNTSLRGLTVFSKLAFKYCSIECCNAQVDIHG